MDCETSPNTAFVWGIFNETIPLARLIESSGILCWSAKWLGSDEVFFDSIHQSSKKNLLKGIHSLLSTADVVITYNGNRFDLPVLNKEFLLAEMLPPSPYKSLDLYQTMKRQFRFTSNKLDHICEQLGYGKKKNTNFQLWVDCMNKDSVAWAKMEAYNKHDTILLEQVYHRVKPWIKNHPNQNLYTDGEHVCPSCGGTKLQKRGVSYTISGRYQRYQCKTCGGWSRNTKKIAESVAIQGAK